MLPHAGSVWEAQKQLDLDISRFEAILPTKLSSEYSILITKALKETPTYDDTLNFISAFNRGVSANNSILGYKSHFGCFLQSVQQFTKLGNILSGGPGYRTACAVWSLVRITFLVSIFPCGLHAFILINRSRSSVYHSLQ